MNAIEPGTEVVGIILAAGMGSRMRSRKPKPLHRAAGKELIRYPVDLLIGLGVRQIVVVTSPDNRAAIADAVGDEVLCAVQPAPRGTGDAVAHGLEAVPDLPSTVMVLNADTPLVRESSLRQMMADHAGVAERRMTILSAPDAFGPDLGRIRRCQADDAHSPGHVAAIIEARDLDRIDEGPAEVNTGVYCFDAKWLASNIRKVPEAPSGERYLTALVAMAVSQGEIVSATPVALPDEAMGVNDRIQLAAVENVLRDRINLHWMAEGVTIVDVATTYIDADVAIGPDTVILPNTMLTGRTTIGDECEVGPNTVVRDTTIGDRCRIIASVLEESRVESDVDIGPYSHLRPGAAIETGVHLGNYVEVKNSRVGANTAAGHFCYLGDADVGSGVNIGAGTITCNYDGVNKHRTVIGDGAFVGSDTMLIAPVTLGQSAATGAGAVVTKDVPEARRAVGVPARLLPISDREND